MSDSNKNKRKNLPDFLRYRRDEMRGRERNSFERELQKDPFLAEAVEGLSSVSASEAARDIKELKKTLNKRRTVRRYAFYFRIAVSVTVLVAVSSIFILVNKYNKPQKSADGNIEKVPLEIDISLPEKSPVAENITSDNNKIKMESRIPEYDSVEIKREVSYSIADLSKSDESKKIISDSILAKDLSLQAVSMAGKIAAVPAVSDTRKEEIIFMASGKVISSEDNLPLPGVMINVKGTNITVITDHEGKFAISLPDSERRTLVAGFIGMESKEFAAKTDSQMHVVMNPSLSALSEVVVVGYGTRRSEYIDDIIPAGYTPPKPANGKDKFDRYIEANITRPDSATSGQRVVVVIGFTVKADGTIEDYRIIRSPSKLFSDEALRLIKYGPAWIPAEENGKKIEDEVRIRIIFK